jgi:hypothetical protein
VSTRRTSASSTRHPSHPARGRGGFARAVLFALALVLPLVSLAWPGAARAHAPTFAVYSKVEATTSGDRVAFVFGLDKLPMTMLLEREAAEGGKLDLADVGQYRAFFSKYLFDRFTVANAGAPCTHPGELARFFWDAKLNYVVAVTTFTCGAPLTNLTIRSLVTHDIPYPHELVADLQHGAVIVRRFFLADDVEATIDLGSLPPSGIVTPWRPKRHGVISYVTEPRPNRIFDEITAAELGVDVAALRGPGSSPSPQTAPGAADSADAPCPPSVLDFIGQGILHIFTGYDHVLFILTLVVAVRSWRHLAVIVTSFTVAHSITLALATFAVVTVSGRVVEPLIALTVLFVALDAALRPRAPVRASVAFAFGLIHGLGLSSVLRDLGLSGRTLLPALFGFNVGVEIGQLLIVGPAFALVLALRKNEARFDRTRRILCTSVAVVAVFWIVIRLRDAFAPT